MGCSCFSQSWHVREKKKCLTSMVARYGPRPVMMTSCAPRSQFFYNPACTVSFSVDRLITCPSSTTEATYDSQTERHDEKDTNGDTNNNENHRASPRRKTMRK